MEHEEELGGCDGCGYMNEPGVWNVVIGRLRVLLLVMLVWVVSMEWIFNFTFEPVFF